jgi:hypothetical protein
VAVAVDQRTCSTLTQVTREILVKYQVIGSSTVPSLINMLGFVRLSAFLLPSVSSLRDAGDPAKSSLIARFQHSMISNPILRLAPASRFESCVTKHEGRCPEGSEKGGDVQAVRHGNQGREGGSADDPRWPNRITPQGGNGTHTPVSLDGWEDPQSIGGQKNA